MANYTNKFNFCGEIMIPKRSPLVKREHKNSDMISMNLGIKNGANCVFVTAKEFKNSIIKTRNDDNEPIEIDWNDRLDEDVIKSVRPGNRYVVDLNERKEFITQWDMIEYLETILPSYEGKIVVSGRFVKRPYKDRFFDEFQVRNVYAADANAKPRFKLNLELYYNKDSVDTSNVKEDGKIYLNAYVPMWMGSEEGVKLMPQTLVFNTAIYDMENPMHKTQYELKMHELMVKSKTPVRMGWELVVINGAEEKEFDESCLTELQRKYVEAGLKTLEDYKRGRVLGERVKEYRLFLPDLTGDFANGCVDSGYTAKEFEEAIYVPSRDESFADVEKNTSKSNDSVAHEEKDAVGLGDLF